MRPISPLAGHSQQTCGYQPETQHLGSEIDLRTSQNDHVKFTLRFGVWQVIAVLFVISKLGNVFSVLTWAYVGAPPLPALPFANLTSRTAIHFSAFQSWSPLWHAWFALCVRRSFKWKEVHLNRTVCSDANRNMTLYGTCTTAKQVVPIMNNTNPVCMCIQRFVCAGSWRLM